jgi:type II secretory pathway component GspD/PulD (secretin)
VPPTPVPAADNGTPAAAPAPAPAAVPGAAPSGNGAEKPKDENKTEAATRTLEIQKSEHGWDIHAINVEAHELLTGFAAAADLPLIVDDTVKRKLTLNITDKSETDILTIIVDAYGFSWAQVDGVHIVSEGMPRTPSSYLLSDIASVTTKYVAPNQAQQLLPIFLQQHVKVNTDQNAVVLSGPKPVLEKFRQDVEQFDVPATQIMLDVNVVEFTDVNTDTFAALLGGSNDSFGAVVDSLTGNLTLTAIADLPTVFFSQLKALVTKRQARVRANPRIATVSGQSANIFIGQQQYLTTPIGYGYGANSINAGVSLTMTPLTGGQGEIILDLEEEISTLSAPDPVTGLPTKTTRSANTTVRVRDGQTIVTGGLRQLERRATHRAIPILSQIPLVGKLFQSDRTENTVVDLAIFITARSLSPTGHLPNEDAEQLRKQFGTEGK